VTVDDPGLSDHSLVQWRLDLRLSSEPVYVERQRRLWRNFDLTSFRTALTSSCLCDPAMYDDQPDVSSLVRTFNETVEKLLDVHALWSKVTCRVRRKTDLWYDNDCRAAKRRVRKLERRYKRWKSDYARSVWLQSLRDLHKLVDRKRSDYWRSKIESETNARELWRAVDATLCPDRPADVNPTRTANDLADFFESKVASIRTATDGALPPTFTDLQSQSSLLVFTPLCQDDVVKLMRSAPAKQSSLDPSPTWLLTDCIDLLSPYLTHLFNASLSSGCVPDLFTVAYITPLLKKPGTDVDAVENYRPVSNLSVLSKTLERAVTQQLESYFGTYGLLP